MDPRRALDDGPMSRFQVTAVALCLGINMLDGFDVLAIAFTAPAIAAEWAVSARSLGVLFSAGLVGMMVGSVALAPLADSVGRRPVIVVCLVVISAGMFASALAWDVTSLAATRAVTGLGIGGALASLNTIVAEYASLRWRDFAVSLLQTGYPMGATVGGTIAAVLLRAYGWRSVYLFGAVLSTACIPLVLRRLPESLDYLLTRRPPGALARANRLLAHLGHAPMAVLPAAERASDGARAGGGVARLFAAPVRTATIALWLAFFMVMLSFYFALNWTPKILVDAGLSITSGVSGGVLMNLGGILGAGLLGWTSARFGLGRLVSAYLAACAASFALFACLGPALGPRFAVAALLGFFLFGSMVGLYAMAPRLYPPEIRTTGIGWAIGVGRGGAVLGPPLAGALLAGGWQSTTLYALFALPLLAALVAVRSLHPAPRPGGSPASRAGLP